MFLTTRKTFSKFAHGFTLIELLIVIAIMGILAAAVLIAINPAKRQNQARDASVKSDVSSLASAAQAYYTQLGYYPLNQGAMVTNGDLKLPLTPPTGAAAAAYSIVLSPSGCDNAAPATYCSGTAVSMTLQSPLNAATPVWCWQSSTGKAQELSAAACVAP